MNDAVTLSVKKRDLQTEKINRLRSQGQIPAVIHNHGKDSLHISVSDKDLEKAYSVVGKQRPLSITLEGKKYTTLIKDVAKAPATEKILHTVFQAVKANEKVNAEVPIHLVGEVPAERASLLVLKHLEEISIEALPNDLVSTVEVDASSLEEVGDKLHVSDIKLPANITLKTDPETVIATVEMPKDQIAEADAALEAQEAAEGQAPSDTQADDEDTENKESTEKPDPQV